MTKKEFVALEKHILPSFPGFEIKGSLMFLPPLEHTLRGFSFEGSAFDKTSFYVTVFFMALCIPRKHLIFNLGERLRDRGSDRWTVNGANFEAALESAMKKEVPLLERLKTPQDVAEMAAQKGHPKDPYRQETIAYMSAFAGQIKPALSALENLSAMLDTSVRWQEEMASRAQLLQTELLKNPKEAKRQLTAWKADTVRNLGLEDFRSTETE
jgi:hypothetical protein